MGVDLKLLPVQADGRPYSEFGYSHTVLDLSRRRTLWPAIGALPTTAVPPVFNTYLCRCSDYDDVHYGNTQTTPYGDPLLATTAGDLVTLLNHECVRENALNRAVWAYLRELPSDQLVALYWC